MNIKKSSVCNAVGKSIMRNPNSYELDNAIALIKKAVSKNAFNRVYHTKYKDK